MRSGPPWPLRGRLLGGNAVVFILVNAGPAVTPSACGHRALLDPSL